MKRLEDIETNNSNSNSNDHITTQCRTIETDRTKAKTPKQNPLLYMYNIEKTILARIASATQCIIQFNFIRRIERLNLAPRLERSPRRSFAEPKPPKLYRCVWEKSRWQGKSGYVGKGKGADLTILTGGSSPGKKMCRRTVRDRNSRDCSDLGCCRKFRVNTLVISNIIFLFYCINSPRNEIKKKKIWI